MASFTASRDGYVIYWLLLIFAKMKKDITIHFLRQRRLFMNVLRQNYVCNQSNKEVILEFQIISLESLT